MTTGQACDDRPGLLHRRDPFNRDGQEQDGLRAGSKKGKPASTLSRTWCCAGCPSGASSVYPDGDEAGSFPSSAFKGLLFANLQPRARQLAGEANNLSLLEEKVSLRRKTGHSIIRNAASAPLEATVPTTTKVNCRS